MTTFFPTWRVDGPPPLPPLFGLLQAAAAPAAGVRFVVDTDGGPVDLSEWPEGVEIPYAGRERWLNGVAVWPYPSDTPTVWDACNPPSAGYKPFGDNVTPPEFAAITVTLGETCTAFQIPNQDEYKARAARVLAAVEGFGVEQEFMNGAVFGSQPYLADGNGTFPNGNVATRPNDALQLLEQEIAASGRLGVIHCSPMFATSLLQNGLSISDKTGVIRTINGIPVIPGFGYATPSTPTGHPAPAGREEWVYATGPIDIRRSEIFTTPDTLAQALDRSLGATNARPNTITYRAERYYAIDWDTAVQAAVLCDRCSSTCGTGS
jgi:hypothetical protein